MYMKNRLCSSLSRLVLPGLMALTLFTPVFVRANVITFYVQGGTAENVSGSLGSCAFLATCAFSGTFQVDVTTGTIETSGVDFTFPGLDAFNILASSNNLFAPDWQILVNNSSGYQMSLLFTTAPTPGSLVGFTGGSLTGANDVFNINASILIYDNISGSITPVPEPSSLILLGTGALGLFGPIRRKLLPHRK